MSKRNKYLITKIETGEISSITLNYLGLTDCKCSLKLHWFYINNYNNNIALFVTDPLKTHIYLNTCLRCHKMSSLA